LSWCDSLDIKGEKFNNISISAEVNEFNYITYINLKFHAENPPGFYYVGSIPVTEFKTKEDLLKLVKKQIKLANTSIADAIFRANQYNLFDSN